MTCTRWAASTVALLAIAVWPVASIGADQIAWHATFNDALASARRSGKLVAVDFYAEWCEPCKMLEHETFPHPDVIRAGATFEWARVDIDRYPELAMRYNVQGIPNIVFLSPGGELVHRAVGFYPPEPFADVLSVTAPLGRQLDELQKRPDDATANYDAAMTYLALQRPAEAQPLFEKVLRTTPKKHRDRRIGAVAGRAACLAFSAKPRKALRRLRPLLKRNPSGEHAPMLKWHIAYAYFRMDEFGRSRQAAEALVEDHGESRWAGRAKPLIERAEQLAG